ncbi:MAG: outer membrane protein assembly factor BamE [Alphaproteobacteria bacterium]|nr:outer membrane protein assembly factor BamE [Alphaproteobacteria bacterium]
MIQSSKSLLLISLSVCSLAAAACSPTVAQRGNLIEDYQLAEIKVNESTRSDVLRTIGSPTTQSTFDPDVWYYIGQEMEKRGILDPEVKKERIVLVAFNDEGFVQTVQDVDRERMNVPIAKDQTETRGNEVTVMQQFLGNLGKFNPNTNQSSATTGGGGI